jgi:protein SCO1
MWWRGIPYLLLLAGLVGGLPLSAQQTAITEAEARAFGLDQQAALQLSQSRLQQFPNDYALVDSHGQSVRLAQYRGKPLLVNFVYTGCFKICPTSSRALRRAVDAMRERFGVNQFQVLSIGFDQPTDSPMALRSFAAQQRIADPNWALLAPRAADVPALARDFGFSYVATPIGFDHTLQVSIVDADGRIHAQVYGDAFGPDSLGEPLRQLLTGGSALAPTSFADLIDKVRILCSIYDPITGQYRVNYSMYLEIAGGLTFILAMLAFAVSEWRARRALLRTRAG